MNAALEPSLLAAAVLAALYVAARPVRGWWRRRRELDHLDDLSGERLDPPSDAAPASVSRQLMAAGLAGPAEAYVLAATLLAAGAVVAMLRVLPALPLAAVIAGALALYAPWVLVGELARRRAFRFEQQLLDVIDFTAGSLQAGGSVAHALYGAASAAPQPLRGAFEESFRAVDVGMPLDAAIERLNERFSSEGVRLFTVSLAAKLRAGGDLVPMLRAMSETLRDRWRQQRHIRAQLAGARLTAAIAVVLPYGLALVLRWASPDWFDVLFSDPIGPPLLFVAVLLQIVGALWLWRILAREM